MKRSQGRTCTFTNGLSERMVLIMNHKKWELPKCPYCGNKLGFWEAFTLRTQGEYTCTKCSRPSNIKFQSVTYTMAAIVSVLGLGILLLCSLLFQAQTLWGVLLILIPFLFFVFLSPCWMYLEAFQTASRPHPTSRPSGGVYRGGAAQHPVARPQSRAPQSPRQNPQRPVSGHTIVMPPMGKQQGARPLQPANPVYRDATGRPVRRPAPPAGQRPQGQPPRAPQAQDRPARPAASAPRQGGVRPTMRQNMRQTPPAEGSAPDWTFAPPPKKRPQPPRQEAQSILDGMTRREDDRLDPKS